MVVFGVMMKMLTYFAVYISSRVSDCRRIELGIFILGQLGFGQKQSTMEHFGLVQVSCIYLIFLFVIVLDMGAHFFFFGVLPSE